ncbi:hypothetical protein E2562_017522 [Oryza meyeriana var. granulata]|uniref:Uncharacterized protein n=1 Tax=Oryza meyeriana var. granulata TaxID=110450 RepID=A0A6G1DXX2_9ORYZ|nr:hypothetical protein E2562_017522 [Oryza meyeriana var. granulata]
MRDRMLDRTHIQRDKVPPVGVGVGGLVWGHTGAWGRQQWVLGQPCCYDCVDAWWWWARLIILASPIIFESFLIAES